VACTPRHHARTFAEIAVTQVTEEERQALRIYATLVYLPTSTPKTTLTERILFTPAASRPSTRCAPWAPMQAGHGNHAVSCITFVPERQVSCPSSRFTVGCCDRGAFAGTARAHPRIEYHEAVVADPTWRGKRLRRTKVGVQRCHPCPAQRIRSRTSGAWPGRPQAQLQHRATHWPTLALLAGPEERWRAPRWDSMELELRKKASRFSWSHVHDVEEHPHQHHRHPGHVDPHDR
jgi:hypothetical protein